MMNAIKNRQTSSSDASSPHPPSVSVIIPARNAEETIASTLDSIFSQDYAGSVEVIVADGSDTSALSEAIRRSHPEVRIVPNPKQTVGHGANTALRVATGEIVVRCDAHTMLSPSHIRRAVKTLERTGAANVGGRQQPVGITFFERAVAMAMTIPVGAGDARHRLGGAEGPSDTAFLGTFRRDVLNEMGGYDATLIRNQDYELNWRLRKSGKIVWFDPELVVLYRPRGTFRALARQYFDYGRWKSVVLMRHPTSLRVRHLAAPMVVLALAAAVLLALAGAPLLAATLALMYLLTLVAGAAVEGFRRRDAAAVLLPLVLATMHLNWGIGFFLPARVDA